MWRIDQMQPIFGTSPVHIEVDDAPVGGGTGGSIFRARSDSLHYDLCLKTLPGVSSGFSRNLAQFFNFLGTQELDRRLQNNNIQGQLRRNLYAIRDYLPTHYSYTKIPGHDQSFCLCLLRLWCPGVALYEAMADETHPLNTDARYRLEIAKQVCRVLIALSMSGVIHLDCYPDNIFIQETEIGPVITLIDLEGAGFIPRINQDSPVRRMPTAFQKEDYWLVPWWYPDGKTDKWLRNAAHWQLLMSLLGVLTRTPSAVLSWTPENFTSIDAISRVIRERHSFPSEHEIRELQSLLEPTHIAAEDFLADCFQSRALADHLRAVISQGILGPQRGDNRPFLTSGDLKILQAQVTDVRI